MPATMSASSGDTVAATSTAGMAPSNGPMIGIASVIAAMSASSSAPGTPRSEYAIPVITPIVAISVSCPRTQRPERGVRRRSMRSAPPPAAQLAGTQARSAEIRGRSTSHRNTIVSSVASVATSSATVVPTSTTTSESGASGGLHAVETESIRAVSDVASAAGRSVLGRRPSLREERRQVRQDPSAWPIAAGTTTNARPDDRHEEREVDDEDRAGTAHDRQAFAEPAEDRFERRGEQDGDEDEQEDAGGRNPDQDERVDEDDAQGEADPPVAQSGDLNRM